MYNSDGINIKNNVTINIYVLVVISDFYYFCCSMLECNVYGLTFKAVGKYNMAACSHTRIHKNTS